MIVTRFAPSPTGHLHVGNLRTALFNCLLARAAGGTFILRLDDTDRERTRPEYIDSIQQDLDWLGLGWDRLEKQSERLDRYQDIADQLRKDGRLYECFESQSELALRRKAQLNMGKPPVYDRAALSLSASAKDELRARTPWYWRFLLNTERIEWIDGIRGPVSIDSGSLSDPVLIRADGLFLYTLASVVDDIDLGITDIVRGDDHVTNTAVQIQIMEQLGHTLPRFAHHSLLTGPNGEPLAKRLGDLAIRDFRDNGVEPMALLSLLAFLGSSQSVRACANLDEIADAFEIEAFSTSPTKFNESDLLTLSSRVLARQEFQTIADDISDAGVPVDMAETFWQVVRENLSNRADLGQWWSVLQGGAAPKVDEEDREFVREALSMLRAPPFDDNTWEQWTSEVSAKTGRKGRHLFLPLRKVLTGRAKGPEMKQLMPLLQRVRTEI